jgi:hypothetical protein
MGSGYNVHEMEERLTVRVVSLLPSATEIVCALGAGGDLAGVSHECDHPPEVAGRPVLTSSRLPDAGASGDLDRSVRELLRAALAIYDLDVDSGPTSAGSRPPWGAGTPGRPSSAGCWRGWAGSSAGPPGLAGPGWSASSGSTR